MSSGDMLVLRGGLTDDKGTSGLVWPMLDDYQAPYREPKLPPPDFVPREFGVGVPLVPYWADKEEEEEEEEEEDEDLGNEVDVDGPVVLKEDEDGDRKEFEHQVIKENPLYFSADFVFPQGRLLFDDGLGVGVGLDELVEQMREIVDVKVAARAAAGLEVTTPTPQTSPLQSTPLPPFRPSLKDYTVSSPTPTTTTPSPTPFFPTVLPKRTTATAERPRFSARPTPATAQTFSWATQRAVHRSKRPTVATTAAPAGTGPSAIATTFRSDFGFTGAPPAPPPSTAPVPSQLVPSVQPALLSRRPKLYPPSRQAKLFPAPPLVSHSPTPSPSPLAHAPPPQPPSLSLPPPPPSATPPPPERSGWRFATYLRELKTKGKPLSPKKEDFFYKDPRQRDKFSGKGWPRKRWPAAASDASLAGDNSILNQVEVYALPSRPKVKSMRPRGKSVAQAAAAASTATSLTTDLPVRRRDEVLPPKRHNRQRKLRLPNPFKAR